jgi:phenylalanyl-tRNA synthetase beta chain
VTIEDAEVERILRGLGLGGHGDEPVAGVRGAELALRPAIEADLLEELARVYGYNRLPVTRIRADLEIAATPEARLGLRPLRGFSGPRLQRGGLPTALSTRRSSVCWIRISSPWR